MQKQTAKQPGKGGNREKSWISAFAFPVLPFPAVLHSRAPALFAGNDPHNNDS
jgi:hypothetical protein